MTEQGRQQPLLRDLAALESAVAQPRQAFEGEAFLRLNGRRLEATVDEAERAIRAVASGDLDRAGLEAWLAVLEAPA